MHIAAAIPVSIAVVTICSVFGGVFFRLAAVLAAKAEVHWVAAMQRCFVVQSLWLLATVPIEAYLRRGSSEDIQLSPEDFFPVSVLPEFAIAVVITAAVVSLANGEKLSIARSALIVAAEAVILIAVIVLLGLLSVHVFEPLAK